MNTAISQHFQTARTGIGPFLALSRTPHALIDLTTPALTAILFLGHLPPVSVILIGILTGFAGYTAVYGLNDIVDYRVDKEKTCFGQDADCENYLDDALIRHPMAKGVLGFNKGVAWVVGWTLVTLIGAYALNPVCLYIFLSGCALETIYCMLWRLSPLRALVNGVVKACGPIAAIYAVSPDPSFPFVLLVFTWIFLWEIGGQNIPHDWTDVEEDRFFNAKTIPLVMGPTRSALLSLTALVSTTFLQFIVLAASPLAFGPVYLLAALCIAFFMLLKPAFHLTDTLAREKAMALFNRASYYPMALFGLALFRLLEQMV